MHEGVSESESHAIKCQEQVNGGGTKTRKCRARLLVKDSSIDEVTVKVSPAMVMQHFDIHPLEFRVPDWMTRPAGFVDT